MQAQHRDQIVQVWKISDSSLENWVQEAFDSKKIKWHNKEHSRIQVNAPWAVVFGDLGDYLVLNGRDLEIVSQRKFEREFILLP